MAKGAPSRGRKLEEAKERCVRSCRKVHLSHNEYVLTLAEASEFERDMRTILLPGLLEHQQAIQVKSGSRIKYFFAPFFL